MKHLARALSLIVLSGTAACGQEAPSWTPLQNGLEVGRFSAPGQSAATITVVRIDPVVWEFRLFSTSESDDDNRPVRRWLEEEGLAVAVNAGMYATDYRTHLGYMGCGDRQNNARVNAYLSAAAFGRRHPDVPPFRIFDLDETEFDDVRADYACIVQNLRLIKRSRENRWPQQGKRWSEVALAEDVQGRALIIHSRDARSMHDLNEVLLALPLGIVCAQHLEGGPEAQLVYRDGGDGTELIGAFAPVAFRAGGASAGEAVPNVLGVVRRSD